MKYAIAYVILGLLDLCFSLIATAHGIPEGNPVLQWLQFHGLFIPAKLFLTFGIAWTLVYLMQKRKYVIYIAQGAIVLMILVNIFHIWMPRTLKLI